MSPLSWHHLKLTWLLHHIRQLCTRLCRGNLPIFDQTLCNETEKRKLVRSEYRPFEFVGLSSIQMAFGYRTVWHPTYFWAFEYWTISPMYQSNLTTFDFPSCSIQNPENISDASQNPNHSANWHSLTIWRPIIFDIWIPTRKMYSGDRNTNTQMPETFENKTFTSQVFRSEGYLNTGHDLNSSLNLTTILFLDQLCKMTEYLPTTKLFVWFSNPDLKFGPFDRGSESKEWTSLIFRSTLYSIVNKLSLKKKGREVLSIENELLFCIKQKKLVWKVKVVCKFECLVQ